MRGVGDLLYLSILGCSYINKKSLELLELTQCIELFYSCGYIGAVIKTNRGSGLPTSFKSYMNLDRVLFLSSLQQEVHSAALGVHFHTPVKVWRGGHHC